MNGTGIITHPMGLHTWDYTHPVGLHIPVAPNSFSHAARSQQSASLTSLSKLRRYPYRIPLSPVTKT